ncbi:ImmA/IrrE family metallo-endopeptidase [Nocardioides KLBMP 9356]|uniref:ImmA/IrrE family metallo-endopeptidase n=1 Tax=Nocardioides potassii TaxID=2911371 RepID=A0ABS9H9Q3_9ACTN|nr:ImmA/IrrE family metallo-endopeptidase [Nocardioides potassii]MCF6376939.1 ImmA/IrrE family metallo-endopeptidase [Nocardioides potassii]
MRTLDELLWHCADLGVDVEWADLGPTKHGGYKASTDVITLSHRLTRRQAIATLAHELGHRAFGDRCSTPAVERRAWEYAAAFLITPSEYARAEAEVGCHMAALAEHLDVTPKVIEAWRRWAHKRVPLERRRYYTVEWP